jgi:DNA-binding CsgD family transcriptional regulator
VTVDPMASQPIARPTQEDQNRAEVQLLRRCQRLSSLVADLTTDAGADRELVGLKLIGRGEKEILAGLTRLQPQARRSVWNMQPSLPFDPAEPTKALNDRSRARGVDLQLITSQRTVHQNPLLTSSCPALRVGPVHLRGILIDQKGAVLEGRSMPSGDGTAWLVTRSDLVAAVGWIWVATRRLSRAALPEGAPAPLTKRQYKVACLMATGAKNATIARELGISARTVVTEVDAVLHLLGANSRCAAGLLMRGRSPNGRVPSAA